MCSFPILVFSQNNDEQNIGQYIVLFNVKHENKHSNLPSRLREITSRVKLESSENTYESQENTL